MGEAYITAGLYTSGIAIFPHVGTTTKFNLSFDDTNKRVDIKNSSNETLMSIKGDKYEPKLSALTTGCSEDGVETYFTSGINTKPTYLNYYGSFYTAPIFVLMSGNDSLTITGQTSQTKIGEQSFTFGVSSSIIVKDGGLLVIGGSSMILSSSGYKVKDDKSNIELDTGIKYSDVDYKDMTLGSSGSCSHNSITMGSSSTMTVKKGAIVHIGASVYGNAQVTFSDSATLTVGDGTNATYLNIGASNNKSTDNTFTVSGACTIENSWVNLGGSCSVYSDKRILSGNSGQGGTGSLTMNGAKISKSRIYCGSGCGAGYMTNESDVKKGGNGTLTVNADIENSIIYLGGAGSYFANGSGGNGGNGSLTINATIIDSIVLIGSSGGIGVSVAGGGTGSSSNGCNGTLETATLEDTANITDKIVSLGLPAISDSDANINVKVGKIEHSVVFCGTGNYGSNQYVGGGVRISEVSEYNGFGGASGYCGNVSNKTPCVTISGFHEGYLGQQPSLVFNTMTPGVLSLPFAPTTSGRSKEFSQIGEFPRVDNTTWAMTEQNTIEISKFGITGIGDNRSASYTSKPIVYPINITSDSIAADKFAGFGGIIVNPNEAVPSKTINTGLIRVSDESVDIISKNFNDSTIDNQLKCGFIVNNTKPFYINPSNLVVDSSVTLDDGDNRFSIAVESNSIINFSTSDSTIKSPGTLSIDGHVTFKGCSLGPNSTIKSTNATIDTCDVSDTTIQTDTSITLSKTDLTGFSAGASDIPLKFPLEMSGCTLTSGESKITNSGDTTSDKILTITNSTIKKGIEINSNGVNESTISGCTFNNDIKIKELASGSTMTKCELGSGIRLTYIMKMDGVAVDENDISYVSETQGSTSETQNFEVGINDNPVGLTNIILTSPTTIKPTSALFIVNGDSNPEENQIVLSGNYSTNIREQLVSENGISASELRLNVGSKSASFNNFSLGSGTTMKFESGETYYDVLIGNGMNITLNSNIDYIDFSTESGLTVISSNCQEVGSGETKAIQSSKIIQNNITINTLKHYKGSVLKYDNSEFLTNTLALCNSDASKTYQLEISNNSLTNLSSNPLSITSNFVIGKTEVLASEQHPFVIASNAVCQFIGAGQYTPTEDSYNTTTFLNGEPLTISNGYVLLTNTGTDPLDFSGFALKVGSYTIDIKGHLKIDNTIYFKVDSNIIIPEDTTLEINTEANAKVTLKGNVKFIGENSVKIDNVVVQKADETTPREIVVDFGSEEGKQATFNNSTLNATIITNTGTIDLTNSVANFGDFVNGGIFTMISSKTTEGTVLGISNTGTTTWFNAEINAVNNGTLSITNCSSICPRNDLVGPHLSFVGNFLVGSLNLSQDGVLHIQGKAENTQFDGSLQINTVVYLGDADQNLPPIISENANTSLIINSDKYTLANPFKGQLLMGATDGNTASLQINSSGFIDIPYDSIFKVWSNVATQKAVINGIFKSTIGGKTFEYNDNMTLNGTIEMERDVVVKGALQITSNGKLYIGQSAGADDIPVSATATVSKAEGSTESLTKYSISFSNFDIMPSTQLTRTVTTTSEGESITSYSVISTDSSKRIIPINVEVDASKNAVITYSNGVILKLDYTTGTDAYAYNSFATISGDSPNVFFGSNSDVYISNLLEIFGTFYNNKKLTVNARLTCVAGSSIINNGTISVRSSNDNTIVGNIIIGNLGTLTFNGTYNDHSKFNLVVNERSGFVVNDSIIISSTTNEIDVLANSEPQIHTVLVNDDIVATKPHYIIKPKKDDTKASTYTSLTDVKTIDDYSV